MRDRERLHVRKIYREREREREREKEKELMQERGETERKSGR